MSRDYIQKLNQGYYDAVWSCSGLMRHDAWPIWRLLRLAARQGRRMLELGPGMRPRIPVKGSWFIEISNPARAALEMHGGIVVGPEESLQEGFFDVVCAFEVLEHVGDDVKLLHDLSSALARDGKLFISVPIFKRNWSEWDRIVGHYRRYLPEELEVLLAKAGFEIECYSEDHFAKAYTGKIRQKLASLAVKVFPRLCFSLEGVIIRILCWHARMFRPLKWMRGSFGKIPENWAGVYLVCKKAGVS
ncbi:class I SAM-dependent methyltransferase [Candidatus Woesearchaeota archaeon]|nr:class I SAM-dependent methyltransferase [Candidatus Woesearchaeota archaeon]